MSARVLITGGSRGLGLGLCEAFAERGDHVIAACRTATPELEALGIQIADGIELASDEAVGRLVEVVGSEPLDVLICNAAINNDAPRLEEIDVEELARAFDVNTLGAVRVVLALLGALREGSKVMLVSIGAAALNVNAHSAGNYGYRMSKAALTSFGFGLARDLRDRGVSVILTSPGPVDTPMLREVFRQGRTPLDPAQAPSALTVGRQFRDRIDALTLADSPAWQAKPTGEPVSFQSPLRPR
jgi:NAD(P)-dependent dehydrogenase (short-subunit alcohol dehydrogenase family)